MIWLKAQLLNQDYIQNFDKVKQNKLTELDISGLRLRDMPPIVSQCVSVETIILSENELDSTCLPMISPLIHMKYCYLESNKFNPYFLWSYDEFCVYCI